MALDVRGGAAIVSSVTEWLPRLVARVPATVHTKLLVGFLVIAVLLVALGAVGLRVLGLVNRQADNMVKRQERIAAYRQFQRNTSLPASWSWNETTLGSTQRRLEEFRFDLDQLQFVAMDDSDALERLRASYERFVGVVGRIATLSRAGDAAGARRLYLADGEPLAAHLARLTNDLVTRAEADMLAGLDASQDVYVTSRRVVIGLAAGSLGLALLLGYAISWSLIGPVKLMATRLRAVASGDFSQRLDVPNRDELGVLAEQFNRMTVQLQASYADLEEKTRALGEAVQELTALGEVSRAVSSTLDLETVLETIVAHSVQLSSTAGGLIYEYDEAARQFELRATHRMDQELVALLQAAPMRFGEGATGRAAATRTPVQIADVLDDAAYDVERVRAVFERHGYRALLSVPLCLEQRVLGTLTVWREQPGPFAPQVVKLLQTFATQSALALQNARLFRELADKTRQLEVASQHKSDFLANMSHELRTPLNSVIGFSEVLAERMFGDLNDKQAEYVKDIYDSGRHLLSLINDILDLSKIEAGAMELDVGRFPLAPALENAVTLVKERAGRRSISLVARFDGELGEMEGDERKLKQILLNLLSNAIKFTGEGGSVTLEARRGDVTVDIAVRDTGVGISKEDQVVIFDEFRQVGTDYARKVEGTGLGLTLTKRFVEMHGGIISVESEPGTGSVFVVVLPLRPGEETG